MNGRRHFLLQLFDTLITCSLTLPALPGARYNKLKQNWYLYRSNRAYRIRDKFEPLTVEGGTKIWH